MYSLQITIDLRDNEEEAKRILPNLIKNIKDQLDWNLDNIGETKFKLIHRVNEDLIFDIVDL